MYENGPKDSFYLIKFWVRTDQYRISVPSGRLCPDNPNGMFIYLKADLRFEEDPDMTKSYEMNTIFETAINRQIEVQTAAYSFGEEAVSKCEVSFHINNSEP